MAVGSCSCQGACSTKGVWQLAVGGCSWQLQFEKTPKNTKKYVRAARKALAEKAKAERDATRAAEKETKRREQRDAKQLQAMCNLMTTTLMTRLMSQMSPGAMKEILTDFTDSNRENFATE